MLRLLADGRLSLSPRAALSAAMRAGAAGRAPRRARGAARLSYRPGDTLEPVTATRIGGYTVRGFSSSSAQRRFNDASISSTDHGSVSLERVDGGG